MRHLELYIARLLINGLDFADDSALRKYENSALEGWEKWLENQNTFHIGREMFMTELSRAVPEVSVKLYFTKWLT